MNVKLGVPEKHIDRPLADFLDPAVLATKRLAMYFSNIAIKEKDLHGEPDITKQHVSSNNTLRDAFIKETGITPEQLPINDDIKKVESKLNKEVKTIKTKKIKKQDFDR